MVVESGRNSEDGKGHAHRGVGVILVPVQVAEGSPRGCLDSLHGRKVRPGYLSCIGRAQDRL